MSSADLARAESPEPQSVDVVTVAQALHWFDLPAFYAQVNPVARRPDGVFTAWCYTLPLVDPRMDSAFNWYYMTLGPYYDAERRLMEEEYRSIAFPFGPLRGRTTRGRSSSCQRWTWGWMVVTESEATWSCKRTKVGFVVRDLFLLENQLPYAVLKAVVSVKNSSSFDEDLLKFIRNVSHNNDEERPKGVVTRAAGGGTPAEDGWGTLKFRSVMELTEAGIKFKPNKIGNLTDVKYKEEDHTGPFEFTSKVEMGLDGFLDYLRSSSAYQTAKDQGVELLGEEVVAEFKAAWGGEGTKVVRFPVFLRIGRVVE
ncbi:hypothetical protein QJS04_geneDACA016616 [Acorus gramineus]|uniref:Methyltransferase n=1 Tax=Acorus gramineus TaxID=55184 RepID=A0AAV9BNZ3_ACOGR|nr:hypothetical protein QJS04_geneDACA016616 [Acorus gramineus]